jgi:hypothetical protein
VNGGGGGTSGLRRIWQSRLVPCCLCVVVLIGGCRRSTPQAEPEGPAKLFSQLRLVHETCRYTELESLVQPSRLATLVRTLMAVDRLLTASQQLQETAEQHVGPTAAEVCNLGVLADYLGPFSRNATIVSTRIEGDKAWVSYQVGERVPIERVQMRLEGARWRYMPDEADEGLPDLLRDLTDKLLQLKVEAQSGVYNEPAFVEEYARRIQEPLAAHLAQEEQARKARQKPNE